MLRCCRPLHTPVKEKENDDDRVYSEPIFLVFNRTHISCVVPSSINHEDALFRQLQNK